MIEGLFQPMHLLLLLLGGFLALGLLLAVILWLLKNPRTPVQPVTVEDRLVRLTALKQQALINDDEYRAKRRLLLDEI
jgi:hypothetical protein